MCGITKKSTFNLISFKECVKNVGLCDTKEKVQTLQTLTTVGKRSGHHVRVKQCPIDLFREQGDREKERSNTRSFAARRPCTQRGATQVASHRAPRAFSAATRMRGTAQRCTAATVGGSCAKLISARAATCARRTRILGNVQRV